MILIKDHNKGRAKKIAQIYYIVETEIDAHNKDTIYNIDNPIPILTLYQLIINDPIHGPVWFKAIKKETNNIMANSTFKIIKEPKGVNIVITRWVWIVKYTVQ